MTSQPPIPTADEIRYRVEHDWEPYGDGTFDAWYAKSVIGPLEALASELDSIPSSGPTIRTLRAGITAAIEAIKEPR